MEIGSSEIHLTNDPLEARAAVVLGHELAADRDVVKPSEVTGQLEVGLVLESCWQELDCWNAVWSSPLGSSCSRLVTVEATWFPIVLMVVLMLATAPGTPAMSDTPSAADLMARRPPSGRS